MRPADTQAHLLEGDPTATKPRALTQAEVEMFNTIAVCLATVTCVAIASGSACFVAYEFCSSVALLCGVA